MSRRYIGALVSATPPTTTGGESGTAPGCWTLQQQMQKTAASLWPVQPVLRQLWSWGRGSTGANGQSNTAAYSSPVQVGVVNTWIDLSTSAAYSPFFCAVKKDGTLWSVGANAQGQLGINSVAGKSAVTQIGALTTWSKVACSQATAIAIKTDGTAWGWGENDYGQEGLNDVTYRSSPVQIGVLTTWSSVSPGMDNFIAKKTDGTLWAWGLNTNGQCGVNTAVTLSSPVQVGALTTWSVLTGGRLHAGAIATGGTLWMWGRGDSGQLGNNAVPTAVSSPIQVGALTTWAGVSGGESFSIATKTDGTLWTWGASAKGQSGLNALTYLSSPVQVGALTTWLQVSTSYRHTAAVTTDGKLFSWGDNASYGMLGQNDVTLRSSPVQVGAATVWSRVVAGRSQTIGFRAP